MRELPSGASENNRPEVWHSCEHIFRREYTALEGSGLVQELLAKSAADAEAWHISQLYESSRCELGYDDGNYIVGQVHQLRHP